MKTIIFIQIIITSSLLLSACASDSSDSPSPDSKHSYSKVLSLSKRIKTSVYSVLPPQEAGWYYFRKSPINLTFVRSVSKENKIYTGSSEVVRLPHIINNKEEFFEFFSKRRAKSINKNKSKATVLVNDEIVEFKDGIYIFHYHMIYEYHGERTFFKSEKNVTIEDYGAFFQHPFEKDTIVKIDLGQTVLLSNKTNEFSVIAKKFISNIEFYDFTE